MWEERGTRERTNKVSEEVTRLLKENTIMIMRDRKTLKPLGINFTEKGLRGIANKNGVYLACKGRVNNYQQAQKAEISPNVIIERFIPKEHLNSGLASIEIHYANHAKHLITGK